MAAIIIVIAGFAGLVLALLSLVLGLSLGEALMVWALMGGILSMLFVRIILRNQDDSLHECHIRSVRDDLSALNEAEILRATLATTDSSSMSRVLRIYAERDARTASKRRKRGTNL